MSNLNNEAATKNIELTDELLIIKLRHAISKKDTPMPFFKKEYISAVLAKNSLMASKIHFINKLDKEASLVWSLACDSFNASISKMHANEDDVYLKELQESAIKAINDSLDEHPDFKVKAMSGYVWSLLDDSSRDIFKAAYKSKESDLGVGAMEKLIRALENGGYISHDVEFSGDSNSVSKEVSAFLLDWILSDFDIA